MELADCVAVSVYAYAVMSNHFHIVLHVDPDAVRQLSEGQGANRWLALSCLASCASNQIVYFALLRFRLENALDSVISAIVLKLLSGYRVAVDY